jgi:hypothetical protein
MRIIGTAAGLVLVLAIGPVGKNQAYAQELPLPGSQEREEEPSIPIEEPTEPFPSDDEVPAFELEETPPAPAGDRKQTTTTAPPPSTTTIVTIPTPPTTLEPLVDPLSTPPVIPKSNLLWAAALSLVGFGGAIVMLMVRYFSRAE